MSLPFSPEDDPEAKQDILLMLAVQNGDTDAFRQLVDKHKNRVAAAIARMAGSQFDHSELAHEVFVKVWKSAARYQPSAKFTTWLLTIARNLVLNEIRHRTRHSALSLDATAPGEDHPIHQVQSPDHTSPARSLEETELLAAIEKALASLPENQRTAIHLRRVEDLSYEEIAAVMETSVASIKSLIFRARSQLKELLSEFLE